MTSLSDWKMQREEVLQLIGAYKKLKCLWDFRSNAYKRFDLRKYSWEKLAKMFGKKPTEVKTKIKYLRSAYVSEKKKVDDSYGTSKIYQPNLFYYNDMNFLDSIVVCRKGPKIENYDHNSDSITEYDERQPGEATLSEQDVTVEDVILPPHPLPTTLKTAESHFKARKEKRRLSPYYSKLDAAVNNLEEATKSSPEDSIYTAFAKIVEMQLSQLTLLDATAAMSEIHQILSKSIIKSMLSNNRTNREIDVDLVDKKQTVLTGPIENNLPDEFEEVSI
ncbi:uncharacterized protein LOC129952412 [Eupeodes corollae]|uniref:uncharacterized protein LOC129952412 n=1 Tax=Eupeodes corollae TaxID=290404 RepID=UPI00249321A8|nr:uncharacterized protein LOC129952412 [Eupeodes corollae]